MNYIIETKDKWDMRYPTAGDYYFVNNNMKIEICKQINNDYEFLIMMHELTEEYLTRVRGIQEQAITDFDLLFETEREAGLHGEDDEPGYDIRSPYRKEHIFAELIERLIAFELGVDWIKYGEEIIS